MSISESFGKIQRHQKSGALFAPLFRLSFLCVLCVLCGINLNAPCSSSKSKADNLRKSCFVTRWTRLRLRAPHSPEICVERNQLFLLIQTRKKPQNTLKTIPAPREYSVQRVKLLLVKGNASMDAISQKKPVRASIIGYMGEIGS